MSAGEYGSLPVCSKKGYYQVAKKRLFSCRGGPMCPPLTEGAHAGAPLQFRVF